MPNKMLIDATHPEETRVVVVKGNRVEEFDFETAQRKQLRGNIYLAKVTRVEPSLQAAFIEYGGNRHGFLAFSEIHPDYYQIPVADRQALIEAEERAHREAEEETDNRSNRKRSRHRSSRRRGHGDRVQSAPVDASVETLAEGETPLDPHLLAEQDEAIERLTSDTPHGESDAAHATTDATHDDAHPESSETEHEPAVAAPAADETPSSVVATTDDAPAAAGDAHDTDEGQQSVHAGGDGETLDHIASPPTADTSADQDGEEDDEEEDDEEEEIVESVGGDDLMAEVPERAYRPRKQYKIQEVIKRRQVMLVQVVKEERGNKGAALTTYLSLAGRYAVLMPNTARGGGISRKITSAQDRARLKDVVQDLDVPEGMGIILRTAGAARSKPEIKRDFEYLLRMWETVRDTTLKSQAPTLVYEEGSLIKRSLRDLYSKDIEDILVAGDAGYTEARSFMKMLMPSNTRAVKPYRDAQPLFARMGVESQLDAMFQPTVQLRSGGYIVLNQTEALVSIDVNSGRSTREHNIEDTALKTNLEAAEEVARQLRLRDLAGLIVIDFIDMDEKRNNRAVERKLSDCLRQDRARIQVGRISHFGLLEMSRQRIRASVLESSTESCPHCGGSGHVRSVASVALQLLRGIEETVMKGATHDLVVRTRTDVALYVLNHKRGHLRDLEEGFKITVSVMADALVGAQQSFIIDRGELVHSPDEAKAILAAQLAAMPAAVEDPIDDEVEDFEVEAETESEETAGVVEVRDVGDSEGEGEGEGEDRPRRRRRRRGRGRGEAGDDAPVKAEGESAEEASSEGAVAAEAEPAETSEETEGGKDDRRPRRRGRRGGRRRRNGAEGAEGEIGDSPAELNVAETVEAPGEAPAQGDAVIAADPNRYWTGDESRPSQAGAGAATEAHAAVADPSTTAAKDVPQDDATETPAKGSRRRSTVREKVSFAPPSQPEPLAAVEENAPVAAEAPPPSAPAPEAMAIEAAPAARKAGWWSRRFGRE